MFWVIILSILVFLLTERVQLKDTGATYHSIIFFLHVHFHLAAALSWNVSHWGHFQSALTIVWGVSYCANATRVACSLLSVPGALPKQWVETSIPFEISNYKVALPSAIRRLFRIFSSSEHQTCGPIISFCVRRVAQKQWVETSVCFHYFDCKEALASIGNSKGLLGAPPNDSFIVRRVGQQWVNTTEHTFDIWNLSWPPFNY